MVLTAPTFRSIEGAYLALLQLATNNAEHHITARGNDASEVIGVGFRLPDPRQRLPTCPRATRPPVARRVAVAKRSPAAERHADLIRTALFEVAPVGMTLGQLMGSCELSRWQTRRGLAMLRDLCAKRG
ncbi:hypothetical protein AB5J56_00195 [Streptomyces sp. R21]|uniref:Uncharacterized protein n=1 Tax=Streptomyces sp. R21 TaxID=3238627 RepID=A0AB39P0B5_9ACTN